jgi:hypothetical protein
VGGGRRPGVARISGGGCRFGPQAAGLVGVLAEVADQVLAGLGDVLGELGDKVQGVEDLEVAGDAAEEVRAGRSGEPPATVAWSRAYS